MKISPVHWHLILNHFPIVLSITGSLLLIVALLIKKDLLKFSGLIILTIAALFVWPVYKSGENAEEPAEGIAGISHEAINTHEDLAINGLRIMLATGVIAGVSLFQLNRKNGSSKYLIIFTLIGGLLSSGYLSYVGYTGGEIRHAEIRGDIFGK